ncbi:hypothetical protein BDV95DRAFT_601472 [Massariosphaeria phaeospora]|uniref:Uncharacterized protein n=1 Tax=Massariosphaeria phaeospora TaxID=100035 RepID=A0A7C8MFN6_9PLEO|nr:hypothetical protein BDV95DRAFT_601472 [Massariosphaeria phaeospora]
MESDHEPRQENSTKPPPTTSLGASSSAETPSISHGMPTTSVSASSADASSTPPTTRTTSPCASPSRDASSTPPNMSTTSPGASSSPYAPVPKPVLPDLRLLSISNIASAMSLWDFSKIRQSPEVIDAVEPILYDSSTVPWPSPAVKAHRIEVQMLELLADSLTMHGYENQAPGDIEGGYSIELFEEPGCIYQPLPDWLPRHLILISGPPFAECELE